MANADLQYSIAKEIIYVDTETNQAWDVTLQRLTTSGKREKFRLAVSDICAKRMINY